MRILQFGRLATLTSDPSQILHQAHSDIQPPTFVNTYGRHISNRLPTARPRPTTACEPIQPYDAFICSIFGSQPPPIILPHRRPSQATPRRSEPLSSTNGLPCFLWWSLSARTSSLPPPQMAATSLACSRVGMREAVCISGLTRPWCWTVTRCCSEPPWTPVYWRHS